MTKEDLALLKKGDYIILESALMPGHNEIAEVTGVSKDTVSYKSIPGVGSIIFEDVDTEFSGDIKVNEHSLDTFDKLNCWYCSLCPSCSECDFSGQVCKKFFKNIKRQGLLQNKLV